MMTKERFTELSKRAHWGLRESAALGECIKEIEELQASLAEVLTELREIDPQALNHHDWRRVQHAIRLIERNPAT